MATMRVLTTTTMTMMTTTSWLVAALVKDDAWAAINVNRRASNVRVLQYGEEGGRGHPYEQYSTHRLLQSETEQSSSETTGEDSSEVFFEDNRYPVSTMTPTAAASTETTSRSPSLRPTTQFPTVISYDASLYEPLRIEIDSRQLQQLVQSNAQKYEYLVTYITETAAPTAATFWSNHLSTIPVSGSITVYQDDCPVSWTDNDTSEYHTFSNADLVLYLILDEGPCLEADPPIAFSNECLSDQFDRPIAGTLLLCSDNFADISSDTSEGTSQRQKIDEVLQHELTHILGMSGATMPYWRDATKGGAPYTPRPLVEEEVVCVNGETQNITMPSQSTIMEGVTTTGVRYFEVVTPTVRNVVANQFDCEDATGARLDHNEYYNCIGSHWSPLFFGTETLVARDMPWEQSITAVTLALLEDTGWYRANYTASTGVLSPSSHGYGAGCNFLTNDCIVDDEVPTYGSGLFCNEMTEASSIKCDVSHKRAARCDLIDYNSYADNPIYPYWVVPDAPPTEYQQRFANSGLGSFLRYDADYCPTYSAPPDFILDGNGDPTGPYYMECLVADTAPDDAYGFETFGNDDSRCFNTIGSIDRPLCLTIECIESGGDITLAVSVGNGQKIACKTDGQMLDLPGLSYVQIECPRREILCPGYVLPILFIVSLCLPSQVSHDTSSNYLHRSFCPANCSGRGICRHGVVNGCKCFDREDTSPTCQNSPIIPPLPIPTLAPSIDVELTSNTPTSETSQGSGFITIVTSNTNKPPPPSPTSMPPTQEELAVEEPTTASSVAKATPLLFWALLFILL